MSRRLGPERSPAGSERSRVASERSRVVGLLAGLVLLAASATGYGEHRATCCVAWLTAAWFWLGLLTGGVINLWIQRLTGGQWGVAIEPAVRRMQSTAPLIALAFVPLAAGLDALYPWAGDRVAWQSAMAAPDFATWWYTPTFFGLRAVVYLLACLALTRAAATRSRACAAAGLIITMIVMSMASFDLLMALTPAWASTVFGWLVLSGQLLGGAALAIALTLHDDSASRAFEPAASPPGRPPLLRDFGNLLLMYVLVQAYLAFMQFLIIWAENLPAEITWYLPRLSGVGAAVGLAGVLAIFVVPLIALLFRRIKDHPRRLLAVAWLLVLGQAINTIWLIAPSVTAVDGSAVWRVPVAMLGLGLLLSAASAFAGAKGGIRRVAHDAS